MLSHLLTNFEIQRYQNKSWIKGAYSRNNLLKNMKDGVNVVNLDENANIGTQWTDFYVIMHILRVLVLSILQWNLKIYK